VVTQLPGSVRQSRLALCELSAAQGLGTYSLATFRAMLLSPRSFESRLGTDLSTSISVLLRPPQLGSFKITYGARLMSSRYRRAVAINAHIIGEGLHLTSIPELSGLIALPPFPRIATVSGERVARYKRYLNALGTIRLSCSADWIFILLYSF
jgi:hypothetical protein